MRRLTSTFLLTCALQLTCWAAYPQSPPSSPNLPAFDAATIKPPDPSARFAKSGFYGEPGGRVFFGGSVKMLVMYAFNLQDYQVSPDSGWTVSQRFEINAVSPASSLSHNIKVANAEPTPEQRLMLQNLLADRFGFKFHLETRQGEVYILTRGTRPLQLKPPKDPAADPRAVVTIKSGGVVDGEAVGINTSTDYLARRLGRYLRLPVLNETEIAGSYDFDLASADPDNQDVEAAVFNVVDRLGLKLKRGRGPIQTLVIDHVEQPSEN